MITEAEIRAAITEMKNIDPFKRLCADWGDDKRYKALKVLVACAEGVAEVMGMNKIDYDEKTMGEPDSFVNLNEAKRLGYNNCLTEIKSKLTRRKNE